MSGRGGDTCKLTDIEVKFSYCALQLAARIDRNEGKFGVFGIELFVLLSIQSDEEGEFLVEWKTCLPSGFLRGGEVLCSSDFDAARPFDKVGSAWFSAVNCFNGNVKLNF